MHQIQGFILAQLSEHDSLHYSDMRPPSMEASQFMYHIKLLMKQGLVSKNSAGIYGLSPEGKRYIDRANVDDLLLRPQPRLAALIVCKDPDRGLLYAQRSMQPAVGWLGFPVINIELGFVLPLSEYIAQEFYEHSGLRAALVHRGDGYINLYQNQELEGSLLAHVFCAESPVGKLAQKDSMATYCWESDAAHSSDKVLTSVPHVLNMLETCPDFFFFEYSFQLA